MRMRLVRNDLGASTDVELVGASDQIIHSRHASADVCANPKQLSPVAKGKLAWRRDTTIMWRYDLSTICTEGSPSHP